jgi:hypothetical protein
MQFEKFSFIGLIRISFQFFTHPYEFILFEHWHPVEIINVMGERLIINLSAWNEIEILKLSEVKEQNENFGAIGIVDTRKSGLVQK